MRKINTNEGVIKHIQINERGSVLLQDELIDVEGGKGTVLLIHDSRRRRKKLNLGGYIGQVDGGLGKKKEK